MKNYSITDGPANTTQSNIIKERLNDIHYLILLNTIITYVTISVKTCLVRTTSKYFFIISQHYLHSPRNGSPKFQPSVVSSFGITVLESRKNKEINLYGD